MKNKVIKKAIKNLITIIQLIILIAPIALQYLSDKKMGVERYLVFKKEMFPKEIFTTDIMVMYKITLILGIIIGIALLMHYSNKKKNSILVKPAIKIIILNLLAIFYVFSKQFEGLVTYHFFLIAIFVILILQYLKVLIDYKTSW